MPSCTTEKIQAKRAALLARDDTDPILSYAEMAADADVSISTFKRSCLPHLAVIDISDKRRGARRSVWEAYKTSRTRAPKAA